MWATNGQERSKRWLIWPGDLFSSEFNPKYKLSVRTEIRDFQPVMTILGPPASVMCVEMCGFRGLKNDTT